MIPSLLLWKMKSTEMLNRQGFGKGGCLNRWSTGSSQGNDTILYDTAMED